MAAYLLMLACCALGLARGYDIPVLTETGPDIPCLEDTPPTPDYSRCVTSCIGIEDGDYQSCLGCYVFLTCSNGIAYDNRSCSPTGVLVWDDNLKICNWTSSTCILAGYFHLDLEANDLGEQYIDNDIWSYIENPSVGIQAIPTGACDTKLFVKLNPPACVKTIDFKFGTEQGTTPGFGVLDFEAQDIESTMGSGFVTLKGGGIMVGTTYQPDRATFPQDPQSPFCGRISSGSLATTQGPSGAVVTGSVYLRLPTDPLIFYFNFLPLFDDNESQPGVCSLTVKWSC